MGMSDNNDIAVLAANREKTIVKTSIIGIVTNLLLVGFKAFVGLVSNSIAVILDAVNNLSDALSSVITIIGAKLGAKQPDKKHPLGYGRIEYLSSMVVASLVIYAGITSLVESVKKIISPEAADYSTVSLVIISVAIFVKLILGMYVRNQGKKVNSGALTASGSDALFDAILSTSVLASAIIFLIWNVSLEAYVGVVIAGFIIKAGIEILMLFHNVVLPLEPSIETLLPPISLPHGQQGTQLLHRGHTANDAHHLLKGWPADAHGFDKVGVEYFVVVYHMADAAM